MRVLQILPTRAASYGGPVKVAESFSRHAAALGLQTDIFPAERDVVWQRLLFAPSPRALARLSRAVKDADLVHIHGLWTVPTTLAARFARLFGRPYLLTPHGMLDRWSLQRSARRKRLYAAVAERATLSHARALHFFNEEEATEARDFGPLPPHFLLPNGVDLAAFAALPARAKMEQRWPQTRGRTVALFLGRIHEKKGFDVLLPALARVSDPLLLLLVAGPDEGGYRQAVEKLADATGVAARIHFVGPVEGEAKRMLLGGADFFVLPSHQEGDSVAIKEALASGLPVLISRRCHFPEVSSSNAGLVVDDTVDGVAAALRMLVEQGTSGFTGSRALAKRYDSAELAQQLAATYRALAANEPLPPDYAPSSSA